MKREGHLSQRRCLIYISCQVMPCIRPRCVGFFPPPSSKSSASYISPSPTGIINRLRPHVRYRWRCHSTISSAVGSQSRSSGAVGEGMAQLTRHSEHQQEWWDKWSTRGPRSKNSITKLDNLHRSDQQRPKDCTPSSNPGYNNMMPWLEYRMQMLISQWGSWETTNQW